MAINLNMSKEEWDVFLRSAKQNSFNQDDIQALLNCDKYKVLPTYYDMDEEIYNTTLYRPYSESANHDDLSEDYITCKVFMCAAKYDRYGEWTDSFGYDEDDRSGSVCNAYNEKVDSYYPFILTDAKTGEVLGFLPLAGEEVEDIQQLCEDDIVYKVDSPQEETMYFKVLTSYEVLAEGYTAADDKAYGIIKEYEKTHKNEGPYEYIEGDKVVASYPSSPAYELEFFDYKDGELGDDNFFEKVKESAYAALDTDEMKKTIKSALDFYQISGNAYKAETDKDGNLKLTRATIVESNDGYVMNAGNTDGSSIITAEDVAEIQCKFNVIGNEVKQAAPKETTNDASLVGGNVQLEEVEEQGTREKQKGEDYGR